MVHWRNFVLSITLFTCFVSTVDQNLFSSKFTWDFFKAAFDERRNLVMSPFSIRMGMTLLANAVNDPDTLRQLSEKLHLVGSITEASESYSRKLQILSKDGGIKLGTKVYAFGRDELNPAFLSGARFFNASIEKRTKLNANRVITAANYWANVTTAGMVESVLVPRDLNPLARLIMLSAIAFRGQWGHQFEVSRTTEEMFHATGTDKRYMTEMMNLPETRLPMGWDDSLQVIVLELPFINGSDFSMVFMLPSERDGNVTDLVHNLNQSSFKRMYKSLRPMKVTVKLPRFTLTNTVNVNSIFRKLNLTKPFEGSAFQVFKREMLSLDKMIHGASIVVDEKGVRAAAVSSFHMVSRSAPISFYADRPFVYAIVKRSKLFPLLVGNYAFPTGKESIKT